MVSRRKLVCLHLVPILIFQGSCLPDIQTAKSASSTSVTYNVTEAPVEIHSTDGFYVNATKNITKNDVRSEISDIFRDLSNETTTTDVHSGDFVNSVTNETVAREPIENSTFSNKTTANEAAKYNYSIVQEQNAENESKYPIIGTIDLVTVAAGICLASAILGYFSCVGYRRYMQKKYGSSHIVAPEDVYDTTDLRYFEI